MSVYVCIHVSPFYPLYYCANNLKNWLKTYFKEIPLALLFVNQFAPLNLTRFLLHYKGIALLTRPVKFRGGPVKKHPVD